MYYTTFWVVCKATSHLDIILIHGRYPNHTVSIAFPPQIVVMFIQTNHFGWDFMTNLDDFITNVELVWFLSHYISNQ